MNSRQQMNIVIVGHVDHGKSTVIGRLLADTNSLPEGKLEAVKERCKRESKVFEYAFLLDALKDEQSQGITIDSARCFFKTKKKDYIIIDAPGHIEFLKNMISGAARAESALLVIDAKDGVQENSKRHGYMLSMLGIKQVVVLVNKMDIVDYDESIFKKIKKEYSEFLERINITPKEFIPVSALEGDNIADPKDKMGWFQGNTVLDALDSFEKDLPLDEKPFRMPLQDVYKFTSKGDSRRIVAGRIESGTISEGDKVVFFPSHKYSTIRSIESFNTDKKLKTSAGESIGFTLTEQIYINRGDIMCKVGEDLPYVSSLIKASIFWMGKSSFIPEKEYYLKLGTAKVPVKLKSIVSVLDASNLDNSKKDQVERHEVVECILECQNPVAYDLSQNLKSTGRFVIVDGYDISGGGIITEYVEDSQAELRNQVFLRDKNWYSGGVDFKERAVRYAQKPKTIIITGQSHVDKKILGKSLEKLLFERGRNVYYLGIGNLLRGLDADIEKEKTSEHIRRLGEVAHILMEAGLIVVSTASNISEQELKLLQTVTDKRDILVISIGETSLEKNTLDLELSEKDPVERNVFKILDLLKFKKIMFDF